MNYIISTINLPNNKLKFLKVLATKTSFQLKNINKNFHWLKYAKKTKIGYHFLAHKQKQIQIIEQLSIKIAHHHPSSYPGQIFDQLSRLINTTIKDELKTNQPQTSYPLNLSEKNYLNQQLIEVINHPIYLPLYPWFMPLKKISPYQWQIKNLATGQQLIIKKKSKLNHLHYFITIANTQVTKK